MPISPLKIRTVWKSESKPFSFLAYNFKSSMKRRWFIFSLWLENWYALFELRKITLNGIRQSTNNKIDSESPWNIPCFMSTPPRDWLLHVKSPLHAFILSDKKCLICSVTPTVSRHSTIQSVEPFHVLSYNQSMWLLGFSFSLAPPTVSFCQ